MDKIKKKEGENYQQLLKRLPFNESFKNVNIIIHNFIKKKKEDVPQSYKSYIAKIYRNIKNWCQAYIIRDLKYPIYNQRTN